MFRAWKIGRLFGIPVYFHWSCALLLIPALAGAGPSSRARLLTAALVPATLTCVVLHEFGHALAARLYGIRTRDITLYPIGGVAPWRDSGNIRSRSSSSPWPVPPSTSASASSWRCCC